SRGNRTVDVPINGLTPKLRRRRGARSLRGHGLYGTRRARARPPRLANRARACLLAPARSGALAATGSHSTFRKLYCAGDDMTTEPLRIPLARIVADEAYQPRVSGLDRKHLALLAASDPADWPPLLVTPLGNAQYALIDGWHRYADAQRRQL